MSLISQGSILEDRYLSNQELLERSASGLILGTQGSSTTFGAGDNTTVTYTCLVPTVNTTKCFNWKNVSKGFISTSAVKNDGTMWSWGQGCNFTLGINLASSVNRCTPTQIGALTDWRQVSVGAFAASAVNRNGQLWGWGAGGTVGDGTTINRCSPVQLCTNKRWKCTIQSGGTAVASYALDELGCWWAWGYNLEGQLGLGTYTTTSPYCELSPVILHTPTGWTSIYSSGQLTFAVDNIGQVWWWGRNFGSGIIPGYNTINACSAVPTQVDFQSAQAPNDKWKMVVHGPTIGVSCGSHAAGILEDGRLFTWGDNESGQMGIGSIDYTTLGVTQVGTSCDWACVSAGYLYTIASKKDGSLWAWGTGDLAVGVNGTYSTPMQVLTSAFNGWKSLTNGISTGYSAIALL